MNDNQSRSLNAAVAGQTFMDDPANAPIWAGKPAVVNKKTELDMRINLIGHIDDKINVTTGNAASKRTAKEKAARTSWLMVKALTALAEDTHDDVLRYEIDFSFGDLRQAKDGDAIDKWQLVHDRANTHVAALTAGGYGVDTALVLQQQGEIDTFKNLRGKPKAAIADKKALNLSLENEFKNMRKIIDSLEDRLTQFVQSNADFYNSALDAFEEDASGVRHSAIRVIYQDAATQIRLRGVKAKLMELNLEKSSSDRGVTDFSQQEAPQANYTLESVLGGYTQVITPNIGVETGKLKRLIITMTKI